MFLALESEFLLTPKMAPNFATLIVNFPTLIPVFTVKKGACVHTREAYTNRTPLHLAFNTEVEAPADVVLTILQRKADYLARDFQGKEMLY